MSCFYWKALFWFVLGFFFVHPPVHKAKSLKTGMNLTTRTESLPKSNKTLLGWIRVWRLQAWSSHPTSLCDFTNVLLKERSKIPINSFPNFVETFPSRVEAVIAAKVGLTSYSTWWIKNGSHLSAYASQSRWANTVGNIVYFILNTEPFTSTLS